MADVEIDPKRRGETLSLDEFARLADRLYAVRSVHPDTSHPSLSPRVPPRYGEKHGEGAEDDR